MHLEIKEIVLFGVAGMTATAGWLFKVFFDRMIASFDRLTESVEKLNVSMAGTAQQVNGHEKRLESLEGLTRRKI